MIYAPRSPARAIASMKPPPLARPRSRSCVAASAAPWALAALCLVALVAAALGRCLAPESTCLWLHFGLVSAAALLGARAGWLVLPGAIAPRIAAASARPIDPPIALAGVDARVRFHDHVDDVPVAEWEAAIAGGPADPWMELAALRGLREGEHGPIEARYAILYRDDRPIAAAYFQIVSIDPAALGRDVERWRPGVRALVGLWQRTRRGPLRVLVCGNVLHSRAGAFRAPALAGSDSADALAATTEALRRREDRRRCGGVTLTMLKDLGGDDAAAHARLGARGYHLLPSAQPAMTLPIAASWRRFDDYLAAMSAKYRKRARAARRRGAGLRRVDLSEAAIGARAAELQALLDAVMSRAEFKLTSVSIAALRQLKAALGDRLRFTAYEEAGALRGFAASIVDPGGLEALFVGLDYEANQRVALYQNILYDLVEAAIVGGCRSLHLGRSALEIKSTVGAAPVPLRIYLRHPSRLMNLAVARALATTTPVDWIQRHPFRDDDGRDGDE